MARGKGGFGEPCWIRTSDILIKSLLQGFICQARKSATPSLAYD